MATDMRGPARRHPVGTFFALAFLLTWAVWVPRALASQGLITATWPADVGRAWSYGPAISAVAVAALIGRDAVVELARRMGRWRVRWWWYLAVLLGPPAFWALVRTLLTAMGWGADLPQPALFTLGWEAALPVLVALVLTDGVGEEPGWRGFALPRQLAALRPLTAGVVLGLVWAVWHLPLVWTAGSALAGVPPWLLFIELPALSIVYTSVFLHTGGSVLLVVVLHAAWNLSTLNAWVAGAGDGRVTAVVLLLEWLVASAAAITWTALPPAASDPAG
jgi:membrane protease YdiL (CAAX protease family)